MHVVVIDVELHLPTAGSLKAKRSIVQSLVRSLDRWKGVGVAEVGHHELWQRTRIGVTIVGATVSHLDDIADSVERRFWSTADVEVVSIERRWVPLDE
jgi:uncharacterized protein YlxP (DUF503 family)